MPQKFRNQFSVPPGRRWFYQVPGGRFVESVFGIDDCVLRAAAAYREISVDVPGNLEELVQDFMCQSLPDGFCDGHPTISNPTWHSVLNSTQAMARKAEASGKAGPQMMQELERRVGICQACPEHSVSMCITCNGLLSAFDSFRRGRRTSLDRNVRVCRATHGLLPVVVHLDPECVVPAAGFALPPGCWAKKELSNV